jgi:gentisate 1,2-dioxygenase
MREYISAYEYEKNVNPTMKNIPIFKKNILDCDYGVTFIDFSDLYNVDYDSTTPNLLASFIKIKNNDFIELHDKNEKMNSAFINGSSHLFYVLQGKSEIVLDDEKMIVNSGDILITPFFNSMFIKNNTIDELQIYYINDSPLINYLGSKPIKKIFKPVVYSKNFLLENLHNLSNPNNNRKGILLSNKDTEKIGVNTITPVLWALYNELPPNTIQRPHKHNSVALDLCIHCSDSDNIYTLLGDELDENGNIVNPTKINWSEGEMFITPPGLWHSHNNTGDTFAYILPIQDAGLLLYQRILGIILH